MAREGFMVQVLLAEPRAPPAEEEAERACKKTKCVKCGGIFILRQRSMGISWEQDKNIYYIIRSLGRVPNLGRMWCE